jgi:hypothetical protein
MRPVDLCCRQVNLAMGVQQRKSDISAKLKCTALIFICIELVDG